MVANATGWLIVALALGALAGLRQGEVRALEVRDVDLKQGIIRSAGRCRKTSRSPQRQGTNAWSRLVLR